MSTVQKVIKYLAMAFAICLIVSIFSGILGAVGFLTNLDIGGSGKSSDAVAEKVTAYPVDGAASELQIDINAAKLTVKQGDAFCVESNLKHISVSTDNGVLRIKENNRARLHADAVVTLTIPAGTVFTKAEITTGAGKVDMDVLSAAVLDLELGAGDAQIGTLNATQGSQIEGGTGRIVIENGALHDLDMEMGVGQMKLTSALTGRCSLDLGVGETDLTLLGVKEDYTIYAEKGLGNCTVDGVSIGYEATVGNGPNAVDVEGGVGAVKVNFRAVAPVAA